MFPTHKTLDSWVVIVLPFCFTGPVLSQMYIGKFRKPVTAQASGSELWRVCHTDYVCEATSVSLCDCVWFLKGTFVQHTGWLIDAWLALGFSMKLFAENRLHCHPTSVSLRYTITNASGMGQLCVLQAATLCSLHSCVVLSEAVNWVATAV